MHRPIFGHSFAVLVAPILLSVVVFNFLNKKKTRVRKNAEDADTGAFGSLTALTGTNSGGSSSSPTETNNGASSLSTAPTGNYYEVFLSFRGPDTREGFTDHLYKGLVDAGICAFRDDEELRLGEEISSDLSAAIKNSKILIPILSVNYGSSKWCLDELVQMMECKNYNTGTVVLPIFYKVEPADVRYQKGRFGDAFRTREKYFDLATLEKWKQALIKVCSLKAWETKGYEGELVKSVVQQVLFELKKKFELVIPENLVGIDSHVKKVMKFVDNNSRATLFVGIYGMGGIGKTTLAKIIYNKLSNQFEHRSFIADIRESWKRNGVCYLQNQLIYDLLKQENQVCNKDEGIKFLSSKFKGKKVLILLDDADADDHLKDLAGNHNWFSSGSVIIITTRDESILDKAFVDYKHDHLELDKEKSLILFSRHAFQKDAPPSEFEELTDEVVSATGGLPLSLEVLGSFLCNKELAVWEDTIKKLRNAPHKEVQETLRISYDALEYEQQQIFLDIACFLIGTDLRIASYMWDACDFYPKEGIVVLRLMSLIKVGENQELKMHDQLRDLGREIVRQENKKEPRYRSRLWDSKKVLKMLEEDEGTKKIEAIYFSKDSSIGFGKTTDQGDNILKGKQFKKLRNLRFLDASGAHFSGDFKNSIKKLKWLQLPNCPSTFEATNFHAKELVVLNLRESKISDEWQGWRSIMMAEKLKYLDLTCCVSLERTSFLSAFENLEVLILRKCERIEQIDSSVGNMKSLVRLDLTGCKSLKGLPAEVGKLEALEQLLVQNCGHISKLPDGIWALQNLQILNIHGTEIKELSDSMGALQNLEILEISCTKIEELPNSIGDLQNLEILNIGCTRIKELPDGIGRLRKLQVLDVSFCLQLGGKMPESICNLSSLQHLNLRACEKLQSLLVLPSSLAYLCITCQSRKLPSLSNLTHLKELQLVNCEFLKCIGEHPLTMLEKSLNTPFELEILEIDGCKLMETLDVSQFTHLRTLTVGSCNNLLEIRGLDKLKYLESLDIAVCDSIERLDLPKSKGLKILNAHYCDNLIEIQGLDRCEFLKELKIFDCTSIERLNLPKSEDLKILNAAHCKNLVEIQGLDRLESLEWIDISGCASIVRLDLPKSDAMVILNAKNCENLVEIQGLDRLESLEEIDISGCASIQRMDLPKSKGLTKLSVGSCKNLCNIQGLDRLKFLKVLNMSGCSSFGRLPNMCCFDTLHKLAINCCDNLHDIQSLEIFPSCTSLWIEDCNSLAKFPNLSKFRNLQKLFLSNCDELWEIPGLEESTSLISIAISGCSLIEILPDFSSCTNLTSLVVQNCEKLTELRGLEKLDHLVTLDISGCKSLKTIPKLSKIVLYRNYENNLFDSYQLMTEFGEDDLDESE